MDEPTHCRKFAQTCRELARASSESTAKKLLDLAADYETLAAELERFSPQPSPTQH